MTTYFESVPGGVYDHPVLYDVLFSTSWKPEIDFLEAIQARYGTGRRKTLSFFEPACGTGRLLWRLAKREHRVSGLDLNPLAISYCNKRLCRHGLPETAFLGDMSNFSAATIRQKGPVDLAFNLVSSFLHLTTEKAAQDHFQCMSQVLKPSGLYVLGLHLHPAGEAACSSESWNVRHGRLSLRSHLERLTVDRRKRLEIVHFRIEASTPRRNYVVSDIFPLRIYSLVQIRKLLSSTPFELLDAFDFGLDIDQPLRLTSDTEDVVFVLKNRCRP